MTYLVLAGWLLLIHVLACMYVIQSVSGGSKNSSSDNSSEGGSASERFARDLAASDRFADYLRWSGAISVKQFKFISGVLKKAASEGFNSIPASKPSATVADLRSGNKELGTQAVAKDVVATKVLADEPAVAATETPVLPPQVPIPNQASSVPTVAKQDPPRQPAPVAPKDLPQGVAKPAPWDLPDPPSREPRRTFSEVMSTFMQEKNMRWGELASGIMIVLSAVGLVVSLRETLENTVPYFSALLFMLITAAIHGAGIYTLKKWKLRNTSRGTLVIGLLLVPINFVMACVLSDHRPLSDPWFWVAVFTGVSVFSFITWHSSKALLRRGNQPMFIAVLGCGLGTLFLNRTIDLDLPIVFSSLFTLPILASFLIGSCAFDNRQWERQHWTVSAQNRLWLLFGIAIASAASALSIGVYRSEMNFGRILVFAPTLSIIFLTMFRFGARMHEVTLARCANLQGSDNESVPLYGLSVKVLGPILLGITLLSALTNPTVFLLTSLLVAIGFFVIIVRDQSPQWLPVVYALFAASTIVGVNLFSGTFVWEEAVPLPVFMTQIVNGVTGLLLLFLGACIGVANIALKRLFPSNVDPNFIKRGWLTGAGVFSVGLVCALVASAIHRDSGFDTGVASGLLMFAAVGLLAITFRANDSESALKWQLPMVSTLFLLGALVHLIIWDLALERMVPGAFALPLLPWLIIAVLASGLLTTLSWWMPVRLRSESASSTVVTWLSCAGIGVLVYSIGAAALMQFSEGTGGTGFAWVAFLNWFAISLVIRQRGFSWSSSASIPVFVGGVFAVFVFLNENGQDWLNFPVNETTDYWFAISAGIIFYCVIWIILTTIISRWLSWQWMSKNNSSVVNFFLYGFIVAVVAMALDGVNFGIGQELDTGLEAPVWAGGENFFWLFAAFGTAAIAAVIQFVVRPQPIGGFFAIALWFLGWALVSVNFIESVSVASAVRWLLAAGGVTIAALLAVRKPLLPIWASTRNALSLSGKSFLGRASAKALINFSLAVSTLAVLWISTIVFYKLIVAQTSLSGPVVGSLFANLMPEVSYGVPILLIVSSFLIYAVSEGRPILATIGSSVFQYLILLALVLIVFADDFGLASARFINLLLAVSVGMTGYGVIWYFLRKKIDGNLIDARIGGWVTQGGQFSQLKIHVLLNGLLISCLAGTVILNVFLKPEESQMWINRIGGWGGVITWLLFGVLVFFVYKNAERKRLGITTTLWFTGLMGTVVLGLFVAILDRHLALQPWVAFRVVSFGFLAIHVIQVVFLVWGARNLESDGSQLKKSLLEHQLALATPLYMTAVVAMTFLLKGVWGDVQQSELYYIYLGAIGLLSVCITQAGWALRFGLNGFASLAIALIGVEVFFSDQTAVWQILDVRFVNLVAITSMLFAISWTGYYLVQRKKIAFPKYFLIMPSFVIMGSLAWIMFASLLGFVSGVMFGTTADWFNNPTGYLTLLCFFGLALTTIWNDRAVLQTTVFYLFSIAVGLTFSMLIREDGLPIPSVAWQLLFGSLLVTFWSIFWVKRASILKLFAPNDSFQFKKLENSLSNELPACNLIFGSLLFLVSFLIIGTFGERSVRYLAVFTPFSLAIATGVQANQTTRSYLQRLSIAFVTIGVIFLALADLSPGQMYSPFSHAMVRILIVLSVAMFVYGFLVTRWVREGDTWLESLKTMSVVTCGLALIALIMVLGEECLIAFGGGSGQLLLAESVVVAIVVGAMIVGLLTIAVRPQQDPFSLTVEGRMGYVYAAEFCVALLILHVMLSMPWLLDLGLREYWPYITMAICFGGVGVAELLKKRKLQVLSVPLFNTVAVFPVLIGLALFAVDNAADSAMVFFMVGMIYVMISVLNQSFLSAGLGVVFGNIALWIFFDRYGFSLVDDPQLWLIPPAISTLIAAQLYSHRIQKSQLEGIRYICIAVIYVSSTMEIFISGIGENLAPPIILAVLSLAGILVGMILRTKAFLYFGTLFLFMSMLSMVAHAQQALGHVWPWWAFGIGTGIAILVMFGVIEKRKNELGLLEDDPKDGDA